MDPRYPQSKMMRLTHWSSAELPPLYNCTQEETLRVYNKPKGLWLSDESQVESWHWWCTSEDFRPEHLSVQTIFEVDMTNVLHLKNADDLMQFSRNYNEPLKRRDRYIDYPINWKLVAEDYKGILITPYIWECRLGNLLTQWYYLWDCASGCFWDVSCLQLIEKGVKLNAMDR